jgi:hypothetical protein
VRRRLTISRLTLRRSLFAARGSGTKGSSKARGLSELIAEGYQGKGSWIPRKPPKRDARLFTIYLVSCICANRHSGHRVGLGASPGHRSRSGSGRVCPSSAQRAEASPLYKPIGVAPDNAAEDSAGHEAGTAGLIAVLLDGASGIVAADRCRIERLLGPRRGVGSPHRAEEATKSCALAGDRLSRSSEGTT